MNSNTTKYNEEKEQHHPQFHNLDPKSKSTSPSSLSSSSTSTKTRVIEIPVQHYQTTAATATATGPSHSPSSAAFAANQSSGQLPRNSPLHGGASNLNEANFGGGGANFPSFNNSSLFDNYQSPFDLLNRRPLINNRTGGGGESSSNNVNTPFSAHFGGADADDFFSQSAERIFGRNSPLKDHLHGTSATQRNQRQASNSPARYGQTTSDHQSAANLNAPNSSSGSNNNTNRQSPLNVNTDSPKRYTTQTTIQPNHSPNSAAPASKTIGVEIPITHVSSSSPNATAKTNTADKSSYSDFAHPKTVPDNSKHSTTPTRGNPTSTTSATTNLSNEGGSASSSSSNMGNFTSSGTQPKKQGASNYENSDFATPINRTGAAAAAATNQQQPPKTEEDKCNEIEAELNALENDVLTFAGTKTSDRSYLKLEEMLTRCLLKLDAIERGEERVNQTRRRLINYTHQLSDKLEARATENEAANNNKSSQNSGAESSSSSDYNQPPASKRSKSPRDQNGGGS